MKGQNSEKLFTIEFSSSSEEDEDENQSNNEIQVQTPVRTQTTLTVVSKKQVRINPPTIGGLIDLSGSYSEDSDDLNEGAGSHSPHTVSHKIKIQNNHNDVFTIDEPANLTSKNYHQNSPSQDNTSWKAKNITINEESNNNQSLEIPPDNIQNEISKDEQVNENEQRQQHSPNDEIEQNTPDIPQPEPHIRPQVSQPVIANDWATYIITREKKTHLNGTRVFFNLFEGSQQTYVAKCKSKKANNVYIMKGSEVHIGSTADALILIGNDGADFSLRKKVNSGDEIMTVRIVPPKTAADTSRRMTITFFFPLQGGPAKLVTRPPNLNQSGKIEFDFDGRHAIESVKNAVLIDKQNGIPKLFIRKTAKDAIEIDAKFNHDKLWIFAVGIASFLSMVRGIK